MIENRVVRYCVFLVGLVAIALGILGFFVPLMPGTPFVLLSAWCFANSSQRMHDWMYRQPFLVSLIENWHNNKAIETRVKIIVIIMLASSVGMMWWRVEYLMILIPATLFMLCLSLFIITRPTP